MLSILATASLDFDTIWDTFLSGFSTIGSFIAGENILLTIVAIPLGVGLVGIVMKIFR